MEDNGELLIFLEVEIGKRGFKFNIQSGWADDENKRDGVGEQDRVCWGWWYYDLFMF